MKKLIFIGFMALFLSMGFYSCDKEDAKVNPVELEYSDQQLFQLLKYPYLLAEWDLSFLNMDLSYYKVDVFELWYAEDSPYGMVALFNDADSLHIVYYISHKFTDEGWGINTTYLYLGDYSKLDTLDNGSVDWFKTDMIKYDDNPGWVEQSIPLKDLPDSFGIATKVKLYNPGEGMNPNPRAFLRIGDELKYPWKVDYVYDVKEF